MISFDWILKQTNNYINATDYNLTQLQKNLKLIRTSLNEKYSQKEFVEAVNNLTPNSLTVPSLSKIESSAYNISIKIAKSIFVLLSNVFEANQDNIRFMNLLNIFYYSEDGPFDGKKQKEYSEWILSSPLIDEEILTKQKYAKYTDESDIKAGYFNIKNRNINEVLLKDIRSALSKNLKSLRLICGGSIKDFAEFLDVPVETYKHYDNNKIKLNNTQCKKILIEISRNYSDNKRLPEIVSLITNRYYSNFEDEIDNTIKDYALSNDMTEDIKENLYVNSIEYLAKYLSNYKGVNQRIIIDGKIAAFLGKQESSFAANLGRFMGNLVASKIVNKIYKKDVFPVDNKVYKQFFDSISSFLDKNKLDEGQKRELIEMIKGK